jgi:hypothetical protein
MDDLSTPLLDAMNHKLANPASSCGGGQLIPPTSSPQTKTPTKSPQTKTPTKTPTPEPTSVIVPTPVMPPQGPTPMSCPQGYTGMRPADSCAKFYHCVNGVVTGEKIACPTGTLFDVNFSFCNWPSQVTCDGGRRRFLRHDKRS